MDCFYKHAMLLLIVVNTHLCMAQTCVYHMNGYVTDKQGHPLTGTIVRLEHTSSGAVTDTNGHFQIANICSGSYLLSFQAFSYLPDTITVNVIGNMSVHVALSATSNELSEVTVSAEKLNDLRTVTQTELHDADLMQTRGSSLGEVLKEVPGLNSVQTGPTLSKPVIHGLYSNRVLLINDDVRQEGQQWGSEHAPEIDPFIANKITIVKGAASVRYGSDAIGGVVLVNPDELPTKGGISGDIYAIGASNGQMGATSVALQGAFDSILSGFSWRVQGTLKEAGNFHTPRYYLTNTGLREDDFSATLGYKWKRLSFNAYYSQYYTKVGIFWGAESGNLEELQEKFLQPTPGLPSYFTYKIDRPFQTVLHELAKATATYTFKDNGTLELIGGRQNDIRQEYDELTTTNPAAANSPQLRFQLITHTLDLVYTQHARNGFSGSIGATGKTSGNIFEGTRPLIPNYRDYNGGLFAIERYTAGNFTFEAGVRYDYRWLRVYERNATTLELYNVTYQYNNTTGTIGSTYRFSDRLYARLNAGMGWRPPSINEMYINGEHFSDASFEIGDSTLKSERAINTGLSVNYTGGKFRGVVDVYYNKISNYIYDKPALEYRQLPSGIFPVFDYTQANVDIRGADISLQYDVLPQLTLQSKTTIVRGYNESIHNWLIGMPCDRFENGVVYHLPAIGKLKHSYLSAENVSVSKQIRVAPNSDYVPPPSAYSLFNAGAGCALPVKKNALDINFTVNNITNTVYRDYLDHFRYYADELGINYVLRLKYSF